MKKENMTCRNCINGEPREIGGRIMISCFLTPERKLRKVDDKCVSGSWIGYTGLMLNMPINFQWGEWEL